MKKLEHSIFGTVVFYNDFIVYNMSSFSPYSKSDLNRLKNEFSKKSPFDAKYNLNFDKELSVFLNLIIQMSLNIEENLDVKIKKEDYQLLDPQQRVSFILSTSHIEEELLQFILKDNSKINYKGGTFPIPWFLFFNKKIKFYDEFFKNRQVFEPILDIFSIEELQLLLNKAPYQQFQKIQKNSQINKNVTIKKEADSLNNSNYAYVREVLLKANNLPNLDLIGNLLEKLNEEEFEKVFFAFKYPNQNSLLEIALNESLTFKQRSLALYCLKEFPDNLLDYLLKVENNSLLKEFAKNLFLDGKTILKLLNSPNNTPANESDNLRSILFTEQWKNPNIPVELIKESLNFENCISTNFIKNHFVKLDTEVLNSLIARQDEWLIKVIIKQLKKHPESLSLLTPSSKQIILKFNPTINF